MKTLAIIKQNVTDAFMRFPVAFLASACFFLLALMEFKDESVLAALACTCFWAISASLFVESHNGKKWHAILAGLAGGVALLSIFHASPDEEWVLLLVGAACLSSMKVAPYLRKDADAEDMGFFCCSIVRNIAFTFWVAFVLFLGGAAILASLHYLFGLRLHHEVYFKFWLFCATFFAPVFAMGELPRDFNQKVETYTKPQRIIIINMLLPLMVVYAVILWLYIAKIAVLMELPKGNVAYMVSAFSLGGLLLYFFSTLQASALYGLMRFWRRYFPLILSAPLVLLVIGIYTRIRAYGVTEDRYAVALLTAWLVGAVLWIAVNRQNTQKLIWIYASGVALVFLASFGPWSAASLSQASQVGRLESLLRGHNLLSAEGYITPQKDTDIPKHEVQEISSIVRYLDRTGKIPALRPWFANIPDSVVHRNQKRYFGVAAIMEDMGLQYLNSYKSQSHIPFHHTNDPTLSSTPFDIAGYDRMVRVYIAVRKDNKATAKFGQGFTAELDSAQTHLTVTLKEGKSMVFSLEDVIMALKDNNPKAEKIANIPVIAESPSLRGKLYVTNINGYFDEKNTVHIQNLNIILLYQYR